MIRKLLIVAVFILSCSSLHARMQGDGAFIRGPGRPTAAAAIGDYLNDPNCLQAFILNDGAADATDRCGANDLTLAGGTWAGSNDGYTFDVTDASGTFTPALTNWQGADWTIAILTTLTATQSARLVQITQAGDSNHYMYLQASPYAAEAKATIRLNRDFNGYKQAQQSTASTAKQWIFVEYDYVDGNTDPNV